MSCFFNLVCSKKSRKLLIKWIWEELPTSPRRGWVKKIIQEGCTIDVKRDSRLFKKLSFLAVLNFSLLIDTMC